MARQWILNSQLGFEKSLEYQVDLPIPSAADIGPKQVLVRWKGASLNYRELDIPEPTSLQGPIFPPLVPGGDGAGIVLAVGSSVSEFKPDDHVTAFLVPDLAETRGDDASCGMADAIIGLGRIADGTLRSHAIMSEKALVHAPRGMDSVLASTLSCAWLAGWNALFGLKGYEATSASWILVQGTGGVSVAALQLGVALGAHVVATTSSASKAERLRALGAEAVINYRETEKWGEEARKLTPDGRGFDFVVDVGGNETLGQSLAAVRIDGQVCIVGGVGEDAPAVPMFMALVHTCLVRGFLVGSRNQMKEMIKFMEEKSIVPAVDDVVFELKDAKEAYRRLKDKKHFAKVLIRID